MGILDFFKKNKKSGIKEVSEPSPEQVAFADSVLSIIGTTAEKFGFKKTMIEVSKYFTVIVFKKKKQYIKIDSTSYPTDYPYYYNIKLGEGDSENVFEYNWNSVSILRLAQIIDPLIDSTSYDFPSGDPLFGNNIKLSIEVANKDLLKYGLTFLEGDLILFYQARKELNNAREPYKISKVGSDGEYHTTYEPKSAKQKKKYS